MVIPVPTEIFAGFADDLKDFRDFRKAFNVRVRDYRAKLGGKVVLLLIRQVLVAKNQDKVFAPGLFDFGDCRSA